MSSSSSAPSTTMTSATTSSSATTSKPATHQLESILTTPLAPSSSSSSSLSSQRHPSSSTGERAISPIPMPKPTTLSEWQLLAVLSKANLVQYYDVFIAQGGDDIHQIMACDEVEFFEIMTLVGMNQKPLHVRRMQKALCEYSQDRTAFNLAAFQQIGPPPPLNYTPPGADPVALLLPGIATSPGISQLRLLTQLAEKATGTSTPAEAPEVSTSPSLTSSNSVPLAFKFATPLLESLAPVAATSTATSDGTPGVVATSRATANVFAGSSLVNFGGPSRLHGSGGSASALRATSSQEKEGSSSPFLAGGSSGGSGQPPYGNDFVSLGDFDPNNPSPTENPVLSAAQIARLAECALAHSKVLPHLPPRLVQNKKRVSKEVVELLKCTPAPPAMISVFRKYSAIYGRFDTKRKPHKVLTLHETTVNEAAAQVCLLVPSLLTRRDELFPLARQIVKDAGYHYAKSRKRPCDPADLHSPISSPSNSPPPPEGEYDDQPSSSSAGFKDDEKSLPPPDTWTAIMNKMKDEQPES